MGSSMRKPPVIASSECPLYGVSALGAHHLLIAGGGGQARSGVPNLIEVFLLETVLSPEGGPSTLRCVKTTSFDTGPLATMNLDLHTLDAASGETLLAAGQDDLCQIYRVFLSSRPMGSEGGKKPPSNAPQLLCYDLDLAKSFKSDFANGAPGSSYQKVVRFSAGDGRYIATGGADGRLRIWEPAEGSMVKKEEILAHRGEVGDVDVSLDGDMLLSVGASDAAAFLWAFSEANGASKAADIVFSPPEGGEQKFKIRAGRFTRLGSRTAVYVTVAVPVQRSSKGQRSYLSLWVYNPKLASNRSCLTRLACKDTACCLSLSSDTALLGLGTLSGAVGVFETEDLAPLKWIPDTHGIFVTGVAFLPPPELGPGSSGFSVAADYRANLISVAADKTIQVHHVPWKASKPMTQFLVEVTFFLFVLAVLFRFLGL